MRNIALVGNPNSGKSSLFNALTGANQSVGNWPGVTVEQKSGYCRDQQNICRVIDLPGIYTFTGLCSNSSLDEQVPHEFLMHQEYDCIVNVIDASQLSRNLYLTLQLLELKKPMIVVLNMMDRVTRQCTRINIPALSVALGCPVIPMVASQKEGVWQLKQLLFQSSLPLMPHPCFKIKMPDPVRLAFSEVETAIGLENPVSHLLAWHYLESPENGSKENPELEKIVKKAALRIQESMNHESDIALAMLRYQAIDTMVLEAVVHTKPSASRSRSLWIDRFLLNRWLGIPCFLAVMYGLFSLSIQLGQLLESFVAPLLEGYWVDGIAHVLGLWHMPSWVVALFSDGFGQGISTVFTFVPVIGLLFLFLTVLEDSGYMARAAFVVDRLMQRLGLPGQSFVPMILGFGCNVPAVMAARTLDRERDRILTIMMSPFMSCSARLAIYTLFVGAFFPNKGYQIVFLLYVIGMLMALLTGWLLKQSLLSATPSPLIMELPPYRFPSWQTVGLHAWIKLKRFILNAAKFIVPICMLLGTLNSIQWQSESVLARAGRALTPVFSPMGVSEDNWPATVGLLTGIMAKEVVVGTLNTLYTQQDKLIDFVVDAPFTWDLPWIDARESFGRAWRGEDQPEETMGAREMGSMSKHFHSKAAAFAYLLFVLLYFPCMSVTAAMAKEIGVRWSLFSVFWTTGLAYAMAVVFYQISQWSLAPWVSMSWVVGSFASLVLLFCALRYMVKDKRVKRVPTPVILT